MDRKRNKKVRRYVIVWLVFLMLFSVFLYLLAACENAWDRQRMLALMAKYPEMEAEILSLWQKPGKPPLFGEAGTDAEETGRLIERIEDKYGYKLDSPASGRIWWVFWGAGTCVSALFALAAGWLDWKRDAVSKRNLRELHECLEKFRKGEFENIPDYESASEEWMKLWESLRELGVYFAGLRDKLGEEENSTKALITDISHQLKTPLTSLRMSYELSVGNQFSEEERKEFQEQEEKEIEKLEVLLKELVNLSRLETHMIQLRPSMASLKNTIAGAVAQIYMKAKNKNIEIQVEMEEDQDICHDAKWTEEAIVNVLDNSVKYSGPHTVVTVRVTSLVRNVLIEIEDEGIGIRKEELSKIYHRFYRGTEARKTAEEGAGVGLYLARMILERQGGTISAKQKTGKGAVFRITLPL